MAKKAALSFEQWVAQFVENTMQFFNLAGWRISIQCSDETPVDSSGNIVYAHIAVLSPYQNAEITMSANAAKDFEEKNFDKLTQALVHEIVHIFLDPFVDFTAPHLSEVTRPLFVYILESQTQKLTMVFLKTLPKELIP